MARFLQQETQDYWEKWLSNRDPDAAEQLIKLYMPLVHFHVQRIAVGLPRGFDFHELEGYGMMGLYDALNKYDAARDLQFDTYASFRVRGAILDELRKGDWVPRSLRQKTKQIDEAIQTLQQQYKRPVTAKEVAAETGFDERKVLEIQSESFFTNVLSMDAAYENDDNPNPGEHMIADKQAPNPESELEKKEKIRQLSVIIETLTEREQMIVQLFYYEELTLTEIGRILDVSTSRVSQIHSRILFQLKQAFLQKDYDTDDVNKEG